MNRELIDKHDIQTMLTADLPALILAPMDGVIDFAMRAVQSEIGAFTYTVSEFVRISSEIPPPKQFLRYVPELRNGGLTPGGLPVQVQILGGDPDRMAASAVVACNAGARAIDINFGCPAPTVNRHDGGASLLKYPTRIRAVVAAVRAAVPAEFPVSAKMRLGWDSIDSIYENAEMAAEGGASWLTIHGRTRMEGYKPPAHWEPIGLVRERVGIPVVANGDIWTIQDFRRCREVTGCRHFMLGRGALANPLLSHQIAHELGILRTESFTDQIDERTEFNNELTDASSGKSEDWACEWIFRLQSLVHFMRVAENTVPAQTVPRLKQWLKMASLYGGFAGFEAIKRAQTVDELFLCLRNAAV